MTRSTPDLSNLRVVLVEPQYAGNIGAVCRAMKNFGASDLVLVNPCNHLSEEGRMFAVRARDILESARIVPSLREALQDTGWSIGTTTRVRDTHFPTFLPDEIAKRVGQIDRKTRIALVLGREDNGLTTEELHQCSVVSTIPTDERYSSLNISQSALLYLYSLFRAQLDGNPTFEWRLAKENEMDILYDRIRRLLDTIEFPARTTNEDYIIGIRRIFGRTPMEDRDVRILHKLFQEIDFFMEKLKRKKF